MIVEHSCDMSEAARAAQRKYKREYMRKWRVANKDRVAANNRKYWEKRARKEAEVDAETASTE